VFNDPIPDKPSSHEREVERVEFRIHDREKSWCELEAKEKERRRESKKVRYRVKERVL
jgi:hypothetical protein